MPMFLQEKALALKIGRQKKIQIIDGQQVEVLTGDDEDEEDEELDPDDLANAESTVGAGVEQKMMAVQGQDGQQYVVLEVIQLPENAQENTNVDVKPNIAAIQQSGANIQAQNQAVKMKPPPAKKAKMENEKKQADLASSFEFDDDDE